VKALRMLVACPQCRRQFDASERLAGSRFHCSCGEIVMVSAPQSHEASVVRCSSCGAPREEGGFACRFCSSDFTLHERDLNTICPQCLARISDRAKFCHHCGSGIVAEPLPTTATDYRCPVCGEEHALAARRVNQADLHECSRCGGLWIKSTTFETLVRHAKDQAVALDEFIHGKPGRTETSPPPQPASGSFYRPCSECHQLMARRNYGHGSGVIIDLCRHHGIWFDADELSRVLHWIRDGGVVENEQQRRETIRAKSRTVRRATQPTYDPWGDDTDEYDLLGTGAKALLNALSTIFTK